MGVCQNLSRVLVTGQHKVKQGHRSPRACNFAYTPLSPCCQTVFPLESHLPTAGEPPAATCGCTRSCPGRPFRHFAAQMVIICCPGKLMQVHCVSRVSKKTPGEGRCAGICLFTTGKGHVCSAAVWQWSCKDCSHCQGKHPWDWRQWGHGQFMSQVCRAVFGGFGFKSNLRKHQHQAT